MDSTFVTSAASKEGWPESDLPEIVVVGRSNVGKSSFINALTNRKRLAYVGATPGKTQLINFFDIDHRWMLVDVPGYGFAKLSKKQLESLGRMMDDYFGKRKNITAVVQLIDARHGPKGDDYDMIDFFKAQNIPVIIAATKVDKVPKTKRAKAMKDISKALQLPLSTVYPISSTEREGFEDIIAKIQEFV